MTLLFNGQNLTKSFGTKLLFKELCLNLFQYDRLGLIGPNGSGKSTLLKILSGKETADAGLVSFKKGLKIGYIAQTCVFDALSPKEILMRKLKEALGPQAEEYLADMWLSKLGFTGKEENAELLSGGWKKRLSLAQELILNPDVLLLDEPTNHLDLEGVIWLEQFLLNEVPTYIVVSHDRRFLKKAANRMMEIDQIYPKGQFSIDGTYDQFIEKKDQFIEGQLEQERSLTGVAKRELHWLRQSPKARTTKSQARIDQAHEIFDEWRNVQKRNQQKKANINFIGTERETRKLLVAKNLAKNMSHKTLFKNLDFTLSPKTCLGLIGSNGSGKTTLLRLIKGDLEPDQGTLKRADSLKTVYFDQHRLQLPPHISLRQALSPNGDYVIYQGESIHVNGWCKRFLFSPDILERPIHSLSGGERARISIAHLMLQPADLLLLDEPTNDLDIATLEILEDSLLEFPGAVVLITHDRDMLDRLCNQILVLGSETASFYANYSQWEESQKVITKEKPTQKLLPPSPKIKPKLTYLEKKEFEGMENIILGKEQLLVQLTSQLNDPEISHNNAKLQEICEQIAQIQKEIETLYLRFEELGNKT